MVIYPSFTSTQPTHQNFKIFGFSLSFILPRSYPLYLNVSSLNSLFEQHTALVPALYPLVISILLSSITPPISLPRYSIFHFCIEFHANRISRLPYTYYL